MYRVSLRGVTAHKARLALSTLAVVLGVAFIVGTLVFSDTTNAGFTTLFTATAPDVTVTPKLAFTPEVEDLALVGDTPTLPDSTVATIASVPGVAAAHGDVTVSTTTVVDAANTAIGPTDGAPTLARNYYPSAHSPTIAQGRPPAGPGEITVDATSAARHHVHLGDPLRLITPTAGLPVTVVGLTTVDGPNPGVGMVYLDTSTAQTRLLGKPDQFSAVTIDAAPGTTDTDLRQRLQAALGPTYAVSIKEEQAQSSARSSRGIPAAAKPACPVVAHRPGGDRRRRHALPDGLGDGGILCLARSARTTARARHRVRCAEAPHAPLPASARSPRPLVRSSRR